MISKLVNGSGAAAWIFWLLLIGGMLFLMMRPGYGNLGLFAALFASIKIESNKLRQRVEDLENAAQHG
ncbi:MAG: hypothetical protein ACI9W4_000201 [Rhodothermales bacterium]|jgi:hypothetical protein